MPESESIFEFADKFGVESPLGNWLPERERSRNPPIITSLNVFNNKLREWGVPLLNNGEKLPQDVIPILVIIGVDGYCDKIEVEYKGIKKLAARSVSFYGSYEALFDVSTQFFREFTFNVTVTDYDSKHISDTKSISIYIDGNKNITEIARSKPNIGKCLGKGDLHQQSFRISL